MTTSSNPRACPQCGGQIPAEAPQGLCPACVLGGAATAPENPPQPWTRRVQPSVEEVQRAFPQFEIIELLGAGGMGFVFKARQSKLDRFVALKILPMPPAHSPAFAERFHREARLLAKLNHPNIVTVYDFGEAGEFFYLLMELVDGVNLRQAMRAGKFSPTEALSIVPKICDALQYAHQEGVLHRDIKPENILLDARGRVKIADFGIAKLITEGKADVTLTASGAALGTPHYMAPEQIEGRGTVDHRADIYSLGVVFYEMLTGELPLGRFAAPSAKTPMDERVDEIVMRALAKERELRQQSAGEMKTEVETVAGSPRRSPPATAPSQGITPALAPIAAERPALVRAVPARAGSAGSGGAAFLVLALALIGTAAMTILPFRLFPGGMHALAGFAGSSLFGTLATVPLLAMAVGALFAAMIAVIRWGDWENPLPSEECPPIPKWAFRTAILMLVVSVLGFARTVWTFSISGQNIIYWAWDGTIFLALTSLAIWMRSSTARRAAILVQSVFFGILLLLLLFSFGYARLGLTDEMMARNRSPFRLFDLLALLVWPLSLWTLLHRDVRRAFGVVEGTEGKTGTGAWGKSISGAALVVISLIALILLFTWMRMNHSVRTGIGGPTPMPVAGQLISGGLLMLVVGAGLAGTILGISACREIGRRGGTPVAWITAVFATLAWPAGLLLLSGSFIASRLGPRVHLPGPVFSEGPRNPFRQEPVRTYLPPVQPISTLDTARLQSQQDIGINLARQELDEVRKRVEVGMAATLDLARAERDVAVAEARGDRLKIAEAKLKYSNLNLEAARRRLDAGRMTTSEFRAIEAEQALARLELEAAQAEGASPQLEKQP